MLDKRAYTEAFYIINEMSDELRSKIPNDIIKNIENKMDTDYKFYIEDDINDVELLEDTEKILSVLYTDYLANDEEREIIKKKEKILERNRKTEVSDINIKEIFPKNKIEKTEGSKELIETVKNKWYTNIIKVFKRVWSKIKR